jgi:putative hydrolase of the HAD superfamily
VALTTIGFDADDTLWHSENHFLLTTERFCELIAPWTQASRLQNPTSSDSSRRDLIETQLITIERRNLQLLGYGAKAFTLSMIETAIEISEGEIPASVIAEILEWGHELLNHPVELLDGVTATLDALAGSYELLLITKGDLLHQESKIAQSGIAPVFSGIEILSDKTAASYERVLHQRSVPAKEFLMVGNSVRSDVLPVLELGAQAVHVPYHVTWALEEHDSTDLQAEQFHSCAHIGELPALLSSLNC